MKKKLLITLCSIFFCLWTLSACDNSPISSQPSGSGQSGQQTAQSSPDTAPPSDAAPASAETGKGWPFSEEKRFKKSPAEGVMSGNLLSRNFAVIFDDSGSMDGDKLTTAQNAFTEWLKTVPKDANAGLVFLNRGREELGPLTDAHLSKLTTAVNKAFAKGGTPLAGATSDAYFMLTAQAFRQLGYGEYTIVIITDGEAENKRSLEENVRYIVSHSPVQIFTIGFGIGEEHSLNRPGYTTYRTADNLKELKKGLGEVLAETETFTDAQFK